MAAGDELDRTVAIVVQEVRERWRSTRRSEGAAIPKSVAGEPVGVHARKGT